MDDISLVQEPSSDRSYGDSLIPKQGTESGRKKSTLTSLNHLLNFTVASTERQYSGRGGIPPIGRHRRRNTSHSYNKEEFLQAKWALICKVWDLQEGAKVIPCHAYCMVFCFVFSCQFVVSGSGDYDVHLQDPDKLVEWECIEQVVG